MKQFYYLLILSFFILSCSNTKQSIPIDKLPIYTSFNIDSKQTNETRVLTVWTPPNYENTTLSYPVLYMPDGGIKEDFPHVANTLSKLINSNQIPPMLLVGIENTNRRKDLTGFSSVKADEQYCPLTDGAKNFRAFISDELIPEIEKRYRVSGKKGIIGESLAGLFVMETIMKKPELFDYYIAFDPSLWWNNHYLVQNSEQLFNENLTKPTRLWFAGSSAEDISKYTNQLSNMLTEKTPSNLKWEYSDEPSEKHNTIFRATKEKALVWMFEEK